MPLPSALPRDAAKELWLQGFSHKDIQERTGIKPVTLRQWIYRHEWKRSDPIPDSPNPPTQSTESKDIADRLSKLTVNQVDRILCHLRDTKLKSIHDCKDAAAAVASAYASARKALGLDDDRGRSVTILASFQTVSGIGPGIGLGAPAVASVQPQIVDAKVVDEPSASTVEPSQPVESTAPTPADSTSSA